MNSLALVSIKGGQGKTTVALAIAATLARRCRVLCVDLDSNGNLSAALGIRDPSVGAAFLECLAAGSDLSIIARDTPVSGLSLIPNSGHFAGLDRALASTPGAETLLRESLEAIPVGSWDVVILDTPPSLGLPVLMALSAASRVLIPVEARAASIGSVGRVIEAVDVVRKRLNPDLVLAGIAVNRLDRRNNHSVAVLALLRKEYGDLVLSPPIRETIRVSEAFSHALPVTHFLPTATASTDLMDLTETLFPALKGTNAP